MAALRSASHRAPRAGARRRAVEKTSALLMQPARRHHSASRLPCRISRLILPRKGLTVAGKLQQAADIAAVLVLSGLATALQNGLKIEPFMRYVTCCGRCP